MATTKVHLIMHPAKGIDFQIVFHVPGAIVDPNNAAVQAVITALLRVTRSVGLEIGLTVVEDITSSAVSGADYVEIDKAFLIGVDADGQSHNYKVPGILSDILNTDDETIDFTNSLVTAYVNAITTYAKSPGNVAVDHLLNGRRSENRKPIKNAGVIITP